MHYIEPATEWDGDGIGLFLAGGISGCANWQAVAVELLEATDVVLINPRCNSFRTDDADAAEAQIRWEHAHLRAAHAILFWFPRETLCPITLYELGAWSKDTSKPIFVGTDHAYARKHDVLVQTRLARPALEVVHSLELVVEQARAWLEGSARATK
ncbi:MAG: hypothetical protein HOO96_41760 [Polyangiaceae bacterium]|nr:hypothetical protein [Polyangiaceae bacterium]